MHITYTHPPVYFKSSLNYLSYLKWKCCINSYKCYVNSCSCMANSSFAFGNFLEFFFIFSIHGWLDSWMQNPWMQNLQIWRMNCTGGAAFQAPLYRQRHFKDDKGTKSERERERERGREGWREEGKDGEKYVSTMCGFISKWSLWPISLEVGHWRTVPLWFWKGRQSPLPEEMRSFK